MKHHFIYILSIICLLSLHSCNRFDNFDEPASMLSGKVTYNNEYIGSKRQWKKNPDATITRRVWKKRPHSSICYSRWIIPGITVRW